MTGRPATVPVIVRALLVFIFWNLGVTAVVFLLPQAGALSPIPLLAGLAFTAWVVRGFFLEHGRARVFILGSVAVTLVAGGVALLGPAWLATAVAAALLVGMVALCFGGPPEAPVRWLALLRLRPLGPARVWVLAAVPVFLAVSWNGAQVYTSVVPVPPETMNPFADLMRTPIGHLSVIVLAVMLAPIVEELVFRGAVQGALERRLGAVWGIGIASLLFALVHLLPWVLPLHLLLGIAFGAAVWAARSLWAGIVLHTVNNMAAVMGLDVAHDPEPHPTVWEAGATPLFWLFLAGFLISVAAFAWVLHRMRAASRPAPPRESVTAPQA
jgi:membrane protease YdiL (CAAX protease family)